MMKNKLICALLIVGLVLIPAGCQLAKEEGASSQTDLLVGVYLTTEYLDLFDVEAYVEDHWHGQKNMTVSGDTRKYEDRIYAQDVSDDPARPDYRFPGLDGVAIYCVPVTDENGEISWTPNDVPEVWMRSDYALEDDLESMTLTADLYVDARGGHYSFYGNPMYRTPEGEVYLLSGHGASGDMDQGGTSLGQTVEETSTLVRNGETYRQKVTVKVTVTSVDPSDRLTILQLDETHRELDRQEFLPDQIPQELTPVDGAAYLLVETHRQSGDGEETVDREILGPDTSTLSTWAEGENGFFCRTETIILW